MLTEKMEKIRALAYEGEDEGGAEIVQVIIVLAFAIGLGVALFFLQGVIGDTMMSSGNKLDEFFGELVATQGSNQRK